MTIDLAREFSTLSTPLIADACLKVSVAPRLAPPGIRAIPGGAKVAGRVLLTRHEGSVDVFLEAFDSAKAGDVLVVDNAGRRDEACIGDLVTLEARAAGLAGAVVWGSVRDTPELEAIGVPVFCYGTFPAGPTRPPGRGNAQPTSIRFGEIEVTSSEAVFADADGALFVALEKLPVVLAAARQISEKERRQAQAIRSGESLRSQLRFKDYLGRRAKDPEYTLRKHLQALGGAIEE